MLNNLKDSGPVSKNIALIQKFQKDQYGQRRNKLCFFCLVFLFFTVAIITKTVQTIDIVVVYLCI